MGGKKAIINPGQNKKLYEKGNIIIEYHELQCKQYFHRHNTISTEHDLTITAI